MARTTGQPVKQSSGQVHNYIGLDLSLTASGVACVDSNGSLRYSTTISTKDMRGGERLSYIYGVIRKILTRLDPVLICIEGYAMGKEFGREQAGELGGVIRMLLFEMQIPYHVVPPNSLKLFVTGKGNAEKDMMMLNVYKHWGISPNNNDEGDAIGLAMMARVIHYPHAALVDYQLKAAAEVTKPEAEKRAEKKQKKDAKHSKRLKRAPEE